MNLIRKPIISLDVGLILLAILSGILCQEEFDIGVYDIGFVQRLEREIKVWTGWERQRALSLLGKLALFARLYRAWTRNPRTGRRDLNSHFPRSPISFHPWVHEDCSLKFLVCVEKLYFNVQNRTTALFPVHQENLEDFVFDEATFTSIVTNTMFAYDVSSMYLFCFLTMNRLSALRFLPFCTYGIEPHQKHAWPVSLFQDAKSRGNILHGAEYGIAPEPFDHISGQEEFMCADESFCPDPCCGRRSRRSALSGNFCKRSACLDNLHSDEDDDLPEVHFINENETTTKIKSSVDKNETRDEKTERVIPPEAEHSCHIEPYFNGDIRAITQNRWNVSCACVLTAADREHVAVAPHAAPPRNESKQSSLLSLDPTRIYRFDVKMCVDIDECLIEKCKIENEECVNTIGGHICACAFGYLRLENNACAPIEFAADSAHALDIVLQPP